MAKSPWDRQDPFWRPGGYHSRYLRDTENFIWRKARYSPKIKEDLIPKIYQLTKAQKIRMTTLVNRILGKALAGEQRAWEETKEEPVKQ